MDLRITADPSVNHFTLLCQSCRERTVLASQESHVVLAAATATFADAHRRCAEPVPE